MKTYLSQVASRCFPFTERWFSPQLNIFENVTFHRPNAERYPEYPEATCSVVLDYAQDAMRIMDKVTDAPFNSVRDGVKIAHLDFWDFTQDPIDIREALGATCLVGIGLITEYMREPEPQVILWHLFFDDQAS